MARAAIQDPVERFRFEVQVINVGFSPASIINNLSKGTLSQFARVGFSHIDTPEFQNSTMEYRENIDNNVFRKIPGLQRYNQITMRRGVLAGDKKEGLVDATKDFYRWLTRVNSANPILSLVTEITGTSTNSLSEQSNNYRKDMIVILRDKNGNAAKRWYILNAYPVRYKGSNDLDANAEEKALESITIAYELAFELPSVADAAKDFIAQVTDSGAGDIAADTDVDLGF